ncbi:MAG: GNAT family N-acetyltransferase [Bryobacteraceae bacterium]
MFHTSGWLEAVRMTYGHQPVALGVLAPDGGLLSAVVFCRVSSWFTGRRLISVPYSDHCNPLIAGAEDLHSLLSACEKLAQEEGCKYVELRPTSALRLIQSDWKPSQEFYLHRLDLRVGADAVFRGSHRDCIQRRIRHAEKEGVSIKEGNDPDSVKTFYDLVLQTRRRHGLPPQPKAWFKNLMECMGDAATIRLAFIGDEPIGGILTLQYGKSLYYKYGASDARFHRFGAMPYLFWHAIQDAIGRGLEELDMGRSDCGDAGLITFKERWGPARSALSYLRSPSDAGQHVYGGIGRSALARRACRHMPDECLVGLGMLLYRHID